MDTISAWSRVNLEEFEKVNAALSSTKKMRQGFDEDAARYKKTWEGVWENLVSISRFFATTAGMWLGEVLKFVTGLVANLLKFVTKVPILREGVSAILLIASALLGLGATVLSARMIGAAFGGIAKSIGAVFGLKAPGAGPGSILGWFRSLSGLGPRAAAAVVGVGEATKAATVAAVAMDAAGAARLASLRSSLAEGTGIFARLRAMASAGLSRIFGAELMAGIGSKFAALLARFPVLSVVGKVASRFLGWIGIALLVKDLISLVGWIDKVTERWPFLNRVIMLAIGPVAQVAKTVRWMTEEWEKFKSFIADPRIVSEIGKWGEAFKFLADDAKKWVTNIVDTISSPFKQAFDAVKQAWDSTLTAMSNAFHSFLKGVGLGPLSEKIKEWSAPVPREEEKSWAQRFLEWSPYKQLKDWRDKYLSEKRGQPSPTMAPVPAAPVNIGPGREDRSSEWIRQLQVQQSASQPRETGMAIQPAVPTEKAVSGLGDLMARTAKDNGKPVVHNEVDLNQEEVVKELQATNQILSRMLDRMQGQQPVEASFHGRFGVLSEGMA
jgi:hypothetical protein